MSVTQRRDMGKEDQEGLGKVATTSKYKNKDPLPFSRKPSCNWPLFPPSRGGYISNKKDAIFKWSNG